MISSAAIKDVHFSLFKEYDHFEPHQQQYLYQ